jgi:hypothetical protein
LCSFAKELGLQRAEEEGTISSITVLALCNLTYVAYNAACMGLSNAVRPLMLANVLQAVVKLYIRFDVPIISYLLCAGVHNGGGTAV